MQHSGPACRVLTDFDLVWVTKLQTSSRLFLDLGPNKLVFCCCCFQAKLKLNQIHSNLNHLLRFENIIWSSLVWSGHHITSSSGHHIIIQSLLVVCQHDFCFWHYFPYNLFYKPFTMENSHDFEKNQQHDFSKPRLDRVQWVCSEEGNSAI